MSEFGDEWQVVGRTGGETGIQKDTEFFRDGEEEKVELDLN